MIISSSFYVEIKRTFKDKKTWFYVLLTLLSPLLGFVIKINPIQTAGTQVIINPLMFGIVGAFVTFSCFTLLEMDRVNKFRTATITEAVISPVVLSISRVIAVFLVSCITSILVLLLYLPYTTFKMGALFNLTLYIKAYALYMIPCMWIGILFTSICYHLTYRKDATVILLTIFSLYGFSSSSQNNFILRWINPNMPALSDGFGNDRLLQMTLYNRIFWLLLLVGTWIISLLFIRKYGKGFLGSAWHNMHQIKNYFFTFLGAGLILISLYMYSNQPFYNHASAVVDWDAIADTGESIIVKSVVANLRPDVEKGTMYGNVEYIISRLTKPVIKKLVINSGYHVYSIKINGENISFVDLKDDNYLVKHIEFEIPQGTNIKIEVEYGGYPMNWGFNQSTPGIDSISKENVDLSVSSLMPRIGGGNTTCVNIDLPRGLIPLTEYVDQKIELLSENEDGTATWQIKSNFDSLGLNAAAFKCREIDANNIHAKFYYNESYSELLENNDIDEVLTDVFSYCTEHYGPLRYLENGNLRLIQTSVFLFGGTASNGSSKMSETTFSPDSLSESWKGASDKEILAHEIIHQWWGLNTSCEESEAYPEWSSEGLTVYATYRLYKEKYGEEYGYENYVANWKDEVSKMQRSFYHRHSEYLSFMPQNFADTIHVNEGATMKYSLMPLKIYYAAKLLGGESAMDAVLKELSETNSSPFITYQDFLDACGLTEEDLSLERLGNLYD